MNLSPEKFALSVVASSDSALSIDEKFELYKEAYNFSLSQGKLITETQEKSLRKEQVDFLTKLGL